MSVIDKKNTANVMGGGGGGGGGHRKGEMNNTIGANNQNAAS